MCRGHLGEINWFRATWQHGGAATGFSTWTFAPGHVVECVVKLPVGYSEYFWTKRLGLVSGSTWDTPESLSLPTPRCLAAGFELGGYDLAWLVIERFKGVPLAAEQTRASMLELFETAAEFHAACVEQMPVDPDQTPPAPDWPRLLDKALTHCGNDEVVESDRWCRALGQIRGHVAGLAARWSQRDIDTWCHHDLHGRNAMRRAGRDAEHHGRCVLIDLAMVKPGSWIEDALYLERLCWGREELLRDVDPLTTLARARRGIGLPTGDDADELADLRRLLMAASSPAYLATEGDPRYLHAALRRVESLLPRVLAAAG